MSARALAQIASDEAFWELVGRDGMEHHLKVLLALTELEIERRYIQHGIFNYRPKEYYREEWKP